MAPGTIDFLGRFGAPSCIREAPVTDRAVSLTTVALAGRCPRCGKGSLFNGLLALRDRCDSCGLDLQAQDTGDGPAMAGVFIMSAVTVIAAIIVEVKFNPPLWVHAIIWPLFLLPATILLMRVAKGLLVALHWRHRRDA